VRGFDAGAVLAYAAWAVVVVGMAEVIDLHAFGYLTDEFDVSDPVNGD
jgi:hypothetical protein